MKTLRNHLVNLTAGLFMTGLALNFNACTESPIQSENKTVSTQRAPGELKILKSTSPLSLGKRFSKAKLITVKRGGLIRVGGRTHGKSVLDFKPGDVSQDVTVQFEWESTGFLEGGAQFSPHGTTFNNPVKIRLSYKDADLGDVEEEDLRIWYLNETEGVWELIGDNVHKDKKYVEGYINHFSRYALGSE